MLTIASLVRGCGLTIGCRGCGAVHAFAADRLVRRPRTPDPWGVRPLDKHRGSRR
jgi:hypothetical protein